jgi:hypothetical protein
LRAPDLDRREHGATMIVGGNPKPIPTGPWFFLRPTSALPQPGQAALTGGGITTGWRLC